MWYFFAVYVSLRYENLNKPLHLLGMSLLTYNIDALEMNRSFGIGSRPFRRSSYHNRLISVEADG